DTPPDTILTLAVEREAAWVVATPKLSRSPSGTGDLYAALFAAALVQGFVTEAALEQAVSGVFALLAETTSPGSYEMALVFSAARLLHRIRQFTASPIAPRAARSGAGKTPTLSY